jgi:hypothetical protein
MTIQIYYISHQGFFDKLEIFEIQQKDLGNNCCMRRNHKVGISEKEYCNIFKFSSFDDFPCESINCDVTNIIIFEDTPSNKIKYLEIKNTLIAKSAKICVNKITRSEDGKTFDLFTTNDHLVLKIDRDSFHTDHQKWLEFCVVFHNLAYSGFI